MNKAEILIIDDEPQIRKLLEINLESNDYKVVQARGDSIPCKFPALGSPRLSRQTTSAIYGMRAKEGGGL